MNTQCFGSKEWELWKENWTNGRNPKVVSELVASFVGDFEGIVKKHSEVSRFIGVPSNKFSTKSNPMVELKFPFAAGFFQTSDMLVENKRMVHFTSFEVAQEILSSGLIRLYNPNFGNDPYEVSLAANQCNSGKEIDRKGISELFTISFTEENAINDLTMWKLYGRDGDGVAFVFEMENPIENWKDWYFGSITYLKPDQKTRVLSELGELQKELEMLKTKFCNQGLGFEVDLLSVFGFYKADLFRPENEFRLLFRNILGGAKDRFTGHWQDDHMNPNKKCGIRTYHAINRRLEPIYYCSYPIYWHTHNLNPKEYYYFSHGPQLRIKEVILGHNHDEKKVDKLKQWHDGLLSKLVSKDYIDEYSIEFSASPIRPYFQY